MSYTYIMSDIHGHFEQYKKMLEKIEFCDDDMLYILGDIVDRGPKPVSVLLDLMKRPNVVCLAGNHCVMACDCLSFLMKEITEDNIDEIDDNIVEKIMNWQENGSESTTDEFYKLSRKQQMEVLDFIGDFEVYEEIQLNGKEYILVHAGLRNFRPDREIWDYELDELVWERPDYDKPYFNDRIVITGHTPTLYIESKLNTAPGYIFKGNNHIAIDCGCGIPGGRLGCLRLDDMKEYYVE